MFDYFRGWERKAGLLTLLAACVMAAFWIRSLSIGDVFLCGTSTHWANGIGSIKGVIFFAEWCDPSSRSIRRPEWAKVPLSMRIFFESQDVAKFRSWGGFGIYESTFQPQPNRSFAIGNLQAVARYVTIPFWAIVGPMALLSAWLLISKRRVPNETKQAA